MLTHVMILGVYNVKCTWLLTNSRTCTTHVLHVQLLPIHKVKLLVKSFIMRMHDSCNCVCTRTVAVYMLYIPRSHASNEAGLTHLVSVV